MTGPLKTQKYPCFYVVLFVRKSVSRCTHPMVVLKVRSHMKINEGCVKTASTLCIGNNRSSLSSDPQAQQGDDHFGYRWWRGSRIDNHNNVLHLSLLVSRTITDRWELQKNTNNQYLSFCTHTSQHTELNQGSRPKWCILSMIYSRDTPFWSEALGNKFAF